jgi:hypothetical protein
MLQDLDILEASWVSYFNMVMFTPLEQSKISLLTVNRSEIVRLTVQHDWIHCVGFMYYPGDVLGQASAHILCLEEGPIYIAKSSDSGCCTPKLIPGNKQTTLDQFIVNRQKVGNPCNF